MRFALLYFVPFKYVKIVFMTTLYKFNFLERLKTVIVHHLVEQFSEASASFDVSVTSINIHVCAASCSSVKVLSFCLVGWVWMMSFRVIELWR